MNLFDLFFLTIDFFSFYGNLCDGGQSYCSEVATSRRESGADADLLEMCIHTKLKKHAYAAFSFDL